MIESYGVLQATTNKTVQDRAIEELRILGFTTIRNAYSISKINEIRTLCLEVQSGYINRFGEEYLKSKNELNNFRAPWLLDKRLLSVSQHPEILGILQRMIVGKFYLNQQNLVINPPVGGEYSQLRYHRDLPYQHYVSSKPLAINALLAVDDFTLENGATSVVPASHKIEEFPSKEFVESHSIQIEVKAGSFLLLDCMTFHAGATNKSNLPRIGINHVYSTLLLRPQIDWSRAISGELLKSLTNSEKSVLGLDTVISGSIEEFLESR